MSAWTPPAREMPKSIKRRMKFIEDYSTEEVISFSKCHTNSRKIQKASLFAYHSATVAVGLAAFHSPEDTVPQFTINEKLSKYAEVRNLIFIRLHCKNSKFTLILVSLSGKRPIFNW